MNLTRTEKKYWKKVQFADELIGAIAHDGLLYLFDFQDIVQDLDKNYPRGKGVWYFNESKDRECAELRGDGRVTVNPSVVQALFGLPIVWE